MTPINKRPGVIFMNYMVNKYFDFQDLNLSKDSILSKWFDCLIEDGELKENERIPNTWVSANMDKFTLIYMAIRSRIYCELSHERC